ncbi:MAG: phenylacetate--CoA ligase family protein [Syntrophobacterales bacterium]|nr:MAG: phenylacetate--CoA ligase family protein [Syntrophobacterales bacterium]
MKDGKTMKFHDIYQNVFFRFLDLLRGRKTISRLKYLRQSQHWDRDHLERWQLERLNALLYQARNYSPYYANTLSGNVLPLKSLSEIQDLPILRKENIRNNLETIRCANIPGKRLELSRTGGSTGEPTRYYLDKKGMDWNRGTVYRSAEWAGAFLGESTMQMTGSHYDLDEFDKLKWKVIFFLQRYFDCPVAMVNDEILRKYYLKMLQRKPTSIWGYASGIFLFSLFIERNYPGANLDFIRCLITSSETLLPHQREKIEHVFGEGKVYDHYGSREMYLASECKAHDGYHIHSEVILLEVVDEDGRWKKPGELVGILVTDLSNEAFPFMRYEIGDVGMILPTDSACSCGVTLPRLGKVEGRIADVVTLRDRMLTVPNFATMLSDVPGVAAYQIVQDALDELVLNIVKGADFTDKTESYLKYAMGQLCGDISVRIDYKDEIEVPKSGKRRYVISSVAKSYL